ncbi:MAG: phospholipase D-like domain-containing protein, partial [Gaiellaceae bacterium]
EEAQATGWSDPVTVTPTATRSLASYFNRGIVASQWLSRRLGDASGMDRRLRDVIGDVGDETRNFLAGDLREEMLALLERARRNGRDVYAALFELNDPELIAALARLGPRLRVVLAVRLGEDGKDENEAARAALRDGGVEIHDRPLGGRHLAHNKFLVICDAEGDPSRVWTGSTNWSRTGLCTQANNGLLISSKTVAGWFLDQWEALRKAKGEFPDGLIPADDVRKTAAVGRARITTWFTPVSEQIDLVDARRHIDAATQGILFLMFNPGPRGTLLNDIIEALSPASDTHDPALYIHGVLNQNPGTKKNPISFFHRGTPDEAPFDVVFPAPVTRPLGFWVRELKKLAGTFAMVHSKVVVVDPFGPKPVVMTGSHNLGPKASSANDDNLVIVENAPGLAADYAVNIMGIYNQYRWRYRMLQRERERASPAPGRSRGWRGLRNNDRWQDDYFTDGDLRRELRFWLGEG